MFLNSDLFCAFPRYGFVYFNEDVNIQTIIEVGGCLSVELLFCYFSSPTESNMSSVHIFCHSNRSVLRVGNSSWALPS